MTDSSVELLALRERLQALAAKASEDHNVEVSWYPMKDGTSHPQFENSRGGIAQDEGDYEFYAALASSSGPMREN